MPLDNVFLGTLEHLDLFIDESIPRRFMQNIKIRAEIGETQCRVHLHVRTGWYCGGVVQRGARVREGVHGLARRGWVHA